MVNELDVVDLEFLVAYKRLNSHNFLHIVRIVMIFNPM